MSLMNEPQEHTWAVIPYQVLHDKTISKSAKIFYAHISSLCIREGYCWASNKYFAKYYSVSNTCIGNWIKELKEAGHIQTKITPENGNSREIFLCSPLPKISDGAIQKKLDTPPQEKLAIPYINNNDNNKDIIGGKKSRAKKPFIPPSLDEVLKYFEENSCPKELAEAAYKHYAIAEWHDARGNPVRNWKQKMQTNWISKYNPLNQINYGTTTNPHQPSNDKVPARYIAGKQDYSKTKF